MSIYTFFGIMCLGIGLFAIAVFFVLGKKKAKNLALIGLLTLMVLNLCYALLIHTRLIASVPEIYFIFNKGSFFNLLLYPFFLIFIQSYTRTSPNKVIITLFLFPALLTIGYAFIQFIFTDSVFIKERVLQFLSDTRPGPDNIFYSWNLFLTKAAIPAIVIIIATIDIRKFFKEGVLKKTRVLLSSISFLLILIIVFRVFSFPIQKLLFLYGEDSYPEWSVEIIFSSLFILAVAFLLILQYSLDQLGEININGNSYSASSLTDERLKEIMNLIKALVIDQKYYLNQGISISELSEELGVNSKYLSEAINRSLGKSFPEFLNACRVEKAKELLHNHEFSHYSIDAIANESGFNSRSTFYRVFKKEVGVSPTKFKEY